MSGVAPTPMTKAVRHMAREGRSMLVCYNAALPHVETRARAARALQRRTGLTINVIDKRFMERAWVSAMDELGVTDWWFTTPSMICAHGRKGTMPVVLDNESINVVDFDLFTAGGQFRRYSNYLFRSSEYLLGKLNYHHLLTVSGQQSMRTVYDDWPRTAWFFLDPVMARYGWREFVQSTHLTADPNRRKRFHELLERHPALRGEDFGVPVRGKAA